MSLLVWLPLNNNLDNQGLESLSLSSSSLTYSSGKVSNMSASFNGSSSKINSTINCTKNMTFTCWVKFNSTAAAHVIDCRKSNSCGYQPFYGGTTYGIQIHTAPSSSANWSAAECNLAVGTWYHFAIIYSDDYCELFIEGVSKGKKSGNFGIEFSNCKLSLGARWSDENWLNGQINDFRIYDEALSEEEIYKLSKGLCTHYSFDFEDLYTPIDYIQTDGNQYINSGIIGKAKWIYDIQYLDNSKRQLMGHGGNAGEYWGVTDGKYGKASWSTSTVPTGNRDIFQVNNFSGVQTAGTGGNVYINGTYAYNNGYDSRSESTQAQIFAISGIYTAICKLWSCQVYNISNELIRDFIPALRNADGKPGLYDKVNNVFYTNDGTGEFNYIGAASSIGARDSSGYGNTGIINELTMSWDAKIGTNSLVWDTNYAHNLKTQNKIDFLYSGGHFTLNLWAKRNNTTMVLFATGNPGYNSGVGRWWGIQADGTWIISGISDYTCYIDGIVSSTGVLDTNWHMYTITGTFTTTWDELCFENHIDASQWGIDGKICDIKLFATKLSADDIKKLYGSRLTIKNGILSCDEYTSKYLDNSYSSRGVVSASTIASGDKNCNLALYTQLEYIESNGTQYVDTGIDNTIDSYKLELKQAFTSLAGDHISGLSGNAGCGIGLSSGNWWLDSATPVSSATVNTIYNLTWIKNGANCTRIIDNDSYSIDWANTANPSNYHICLFATQAHQGDATITYKSCSKLYSAKLYLNNLLVRNFIPVKRNLFGDIGLYDTVENKFYGSSTIYPFTAGPEIGRVLDCNKLYIGQGYNCVPIEESDFDEIEYIQSTGTQYIDTNFIPNNTHNTLFDVTWSITATGDNMVFGGIPYNNFTLNAYTSYWQIGGLGGGGWVNLSSAPTVNTLYNTLTEFNGQSSTFKLTVNGIETDSRSTSIRGATGNIIIFTDGGNNYPAKMKLYSFKIYDNATIVRDFIPALRKEDGKPGLYDKVNKRFYTAWGANEFIAGPKVFKHLEKCIEESDPEKYMVAITADYCQAAYTSTNSSATIGDIDNTWYQKNSTVYGFAELNNNTNQYTYVSNTGWVHITNRLYRIGSISPSAKNNRISGSALRYSNYQFTIYLGSYCASITYHIEGEAPQTISADTTLYIPENKTITVESSTAKQVATTTTTYSSGHGTFNKNNSYTRVNYTRTYSLAAPIITNVSTNMADWEVDFKNPNNTSLTIRYACYFTSIDSSLEYDTDGTISVSSSGYAYIQGNISEFEEKSAYIDTYYIIARFIDSAGNTVSTDVTKSN